MAIKRFTIELDDEVGSVVQHVETETDLCDNEEAEAIFNTATEVLELLRDRCGSPAIATQVVGTVVLRLGGIVEGYYEGDD